jgi:hypothetical protein
MKYPNSIPLWHTNGEPFPGGTPSRAVLSSAGARWNDVVVEQRHSSRFELADVMHKQHVIGINIGSSTTWEFKKAGRFRRFFKARGGICFFPSHQPFSCRPNVEKGVIVNVLFLALDPVFVSCACGGFAET